jgi:Holliday junction resolvase RusA-like endonuclease
MIKFTIPIAPISKKNSQRIFRPNGMNRPIIVPSEQYKRYEKEAALFIPKGIYISTPVNVKCLFYMPTRRKCDLTNLLEAIDDVLVKAGLLADDNYTVVESHDGSRVYYDKENPRTEIYIQANEIKKDG